MTRMIASIILTAALFVVFIFNLVKAQETNHFHSFPAPDLIRCSCDSASFCMSDEDHMRQIAFQQHMQWVTQQIQCPQCHEEGA